MDYMENYNNWLNNSDLDNELKTELTEIRNDNKEIKDRFYKNLDFGTGGLRGVIATGTNRMNIYTVRKASQGLANYINKNYDVENKSVVIAYDVRHKSKEFALETALVLAENNIKAYIFNKETPTPILSFAVRELEAVAGVVITASHNPKEYNGYKVYWSDGGQITDKIANAITAEISEIENELDVAVSTKETAQEADLINWVGEDILNTYIAKTKDLVLRKDIIAEVSSNFNIVYSPLHGTGYEPVKRLLGEVGFTNVHIVPEQAQPDPNFSTVKYPNPEEHAAFEVAIKLAEQHNADVIMATDPDADRVGVAVKNNQSEYTILTGNQLGALMIDYILQMRKQQNTIPQDAIVVKTIVTSSMGVNIAKAYGVDYIDVLTGFKYIGEKIKEFQEENSHTFLFGYEESYGYLIGDYVRDKDAVQVCLVAAEMAAYYKTQGITLYQRLNQLFEEFGYYKEDLVSIALKGIEGQERIDRILNKLQNDKPKQINDTKVAIISDYLNRVETNQLTGEEKPITLPKAKVFHYTLEDNSWFCIRPSGTEPKLKIYFSVQEDSETKADKKLTELKESVLQLIEEIR